MDSFFDVLEFTNEEEGEEIEMFNGDPSLYAFKEKRNIDGVAFQLILTYDIETKEMYGFQYHHLFEEGEEGHTLAKKLYNDFYDAYGEPTTYVDSLYRIADLPDYEELEEKQEWRFFETWKKDDLLEVQLQLYHIEKDSNALVITYKPNPPEQDYFGD